jgi:carbamoyl-phosphate synthase large subunit
MNILITAASRRVPLIRFFKEAMVRLDPAGKVITSDTNSLSPGLYFCDRFYYAPLCSAPEYVSTIKKICSKENISMIIPTIDEELPLYAGLENEFKGLGICVVVSSKDVVVKCNDKYLTYEYFLEKGIPTPVTYLPEQLVFSKLKYPLFIKPRFGRGSVNSFIVRSEKELKFFLGYIENPIVQEYLRGREFTIDVLADFNSRVIASVPRERLLIRSGVTDRGVTMPNQELVMWGKRITEEMGIIGPTNIQGKIDGNKIKFFEINPRFSGSIPLTIKSGQNFPELLLRMHMGEDIQPRIKSYKSNVYMICYEQGLFIDGDSLTNIKDGEAKKPENYDIL